MNDAYDVELMIRELVEYELNFLDFPTIVAMVKNSLRQKYESKSYDELLKDYQMVFDWPETAEDYLL
jgi:hypothetical protein